MLQENDYVITANKIKIVIADKILRDVIAGDDFGVNRAKFLVILDHMAELQRELQAKLEEY